MNLKPSILTCEENDIVLDMLQAFESVLTSPPTTVDGVGAALQALEKKVRDVWGGDRVYIARRRGEISGNLHSERNSRIARAYQQGNHFKLIAKQEGISERRARQIIDGMRAARRPASMG